MNNLVEIRGTMRQMLAGQLEAAKRAITTAMNEASVAVKNEARSQTEAAGLGARLARTWRSRTYPDKGRTSLHPAALVWSKAPHIIKGLESGTPIRAKDRTFLAIPTDHARRTLGRGRRKVTPALLKERGYNLIYIPAGFYGPNKPRIPLLVVEGRVGSTGKVTRSAKTAKGNYRKGAQTIVMFYLVRQVRIPRRLDLARIRDTARRTLARLISWHVNGEREAGHA